MNAEKLVTICQLCLFSSAWAQTDTRLNRYREYLFRTHQPEEEKAGQWSDMLSDRVVSAGFISVQSAWR